MHIAIGRAAIAALLAAVWVFGLDRVAAVQGALPAPLGVRPGLLLFAGFLSIQAILALPMVLADRLVRRVPLRPWVVGLIFAVGAAWPAWLTARAITSGDWIAKQSWVTYLHVGLVVALLIGAFALGLLHRWLTGWVWPLLLAAGSAAAALADATVLPGLYPELHLGLEVAVTTLAAFSAHRLVARWCAHTPWSRPRWALALASLLLALGAPIATFALRAQASALLLASPTAANAVPMLFLGGQTDMLRVVLTNFDLRPAPPRVAARPRPPRPQWNVILVVVDTLRADALLPGRLHSKVFTDPNLTPHLDRWITRSDRFRFAYAQASRTMFSMPPMMRSLEGTGLDPFEGVPLAQAMAARGRVPVAILPQYFLDPEDPPVRSLMDGFEEVAFYEKNAQQDLVPQVREVLSAHQGRPFFAWVHFFNMHQPGFAHNRLLSPADGSWMKRYHDSLRWLDGEWGKLMAVLEELKLLENTVILLVADHGEHVGEKKREGHGGQILEPEIRVPWVISIPGRVGVEHPQTVGNIDVAPTLIDAIGEAPVPSHQGRSVLPLLDDPTTPWDHAYTMRNSSGSILGVVLGRQKLYAYKGGALLHRFNIDQDPAEATQRFDLEDPIDQALVAELLVRRPDLAAKEIVGEAGKHNRAMLLHLLRSLSAQAASGLGQRLRLLVGLVALVPEAPLLAELDRLFQEGDDEARLLIADILAASQPAWVADRLVQRLQAVANTPEELALLSGLAAQAQRDFAGAFVGGRILQAAQAGDHTRLAAWLDLTRHWRKGPANFARPLLAAQQALANAPEEGLERLLDNLKTLNYAQDPTTAQAVRTQVEAWLAHASPDVAVRAATVLERQGPQAKSSAPALIATMRRTEADVRVRCAAIIALGAVAQGDAVLEIIEAGKDPLLTYQAIQTLGQLGAAARAAKPWLDQIRRTHWRDWIKRQAREAIKAIDGIKTPAKPAAAPVSK